MGFVKDYFNREKARKSKVKEYEENDRIAHIHGEKKLSHYERELVRSLQADKEEYMKQALHWDEQRRKAEDKLKATQMMKFNPEMFQHESILKEKNNFLRGGDF